MLVALSLLLPLAAATWVPRSKVASAGSDADTYDYIVVGGGTSGLVVANRLSENADVQVLVVEAGGSAFNNSNAYSADGYGLAFGTDIDWAFQTVNQTYAGGATQTMRAGKALGGTSLINGLAYTRAEVDQIDLWEKLGNTGWNWKTLFPYYKKSENFQAPSPAREAAGDLSYDAANHGFTGPQLTGWTYSETNATLPATLNETYQAMGLPWNPDVNSGDMVGSAVFPKMVDQALNIRADTARAYYYPYANRTNLKVLLNTQATRLTWKEAAGANGSATAAGVEVAGPDGTTRVVKANKEVVLSAGALVSPVLLELSGVGNPNVLGPLGIDTVVDLPTVGENLQDQMNNALQHTPAANFTLDGKLAYVAYPDVDHVFGSNASASIAAEVKAALPAYAAKVAAANGNVTRAADLLSFFRMQHDLIFDSKAPVAEVLVAYSPASGGSAAAFDSEYWSLLPFARGSVHTASATWAGKGTARINPNFFMLDWDLEGQAGIAAFIRRLYATAPFAGSVAEELTPGRANVPDDAGTGVDVAAWADWLKANYRSNFHPVGTAAMMPRAKGGVVDDELRVYGTANVRVVDASVLPFQVCGHLVSTLYAVAERAADLIKGAE